MLLLLSGALILLKQPAEVRGSHSNRVVERVTFGKKTNLSHHVLAWDYCDVNLANLPGLLQ